MTSPILNRPLFKNPFIQGYQDGGSVGLDNPFISEAEAADIERQYGSGPDTYQSPTGLTIRGSTSPVPRLLDPNTPPDPRGIESLVSTPQSPPSVTKKQSLWELISQRATPEQAADMRNDGLGDDLKRVERDPNNEVTGIAAQLFGSRFVDPAGTTDADEDMTYGDSNSRVGGKDQSLTDIFEWLDANKPEDQTLEEFAKSIGVRLTDQENPKNLAYDKWDYIRDISTGLLASKDDDFGGALGDAALYTMTNRGKAVEKSNDLRNSLALQKWETEQKDKRDLYKIKAEAMVAAYSAKPNDIKLLPQGLDVQKFPNGVTRTTHVVQPDSGMTPPSNTRFGPNGERLFDTFVTDHEYLPKQRRERLDKFMGELDKKLGDDDYLKNSVNWFATNTEFNGELLRRLSEDSPDLINQFMNSKDAMVRGIAEATADKDWVGAANASRALVNMDAATNSLFQDAYDGYVAVLTQPERQMLNEQIGKRARQLLRNDINRDWNQVDSIGTYIPQAAKEILNEVHWDETDGIIKFATEADAKQIQNIKEMIDDLGGDDRANRWFKFAWERGKQLDGSSLPGTPFQAGDKSSFWQLTQLEKLPETQRSQFLADVATTATKLTRQGYGEKEAGRTILNSILDSNVILGGSDLRFVPDLIEPGVTEATYRPPEVFYPEPILMDSNARAVNAKDLRDAGYMWNGFRNEFFKVDKNGRRHRANEALRTGKGAITYNWEPTNPVPFGTR